MSIKAILLIVISICFVFTDAPSQDQKDVNINVIQVRDKIYMLSGQGGNIGLFLGIDTGIRRR